MPKALTAGGHGCGHNMLARAFAARLWDPVEGVGGIAKGAALMTGTEVIRQQISGDANLVASPELELALHIVLEKFGGPDFDTADDAYAAQIQQTLSQADIAASYGCFGLRPVKGEALSRIIYPLGAGSDHAVGSTDVGVSWVVPTEHRAILAIGRPRESAGGAQRSTARSQGMSYFAVQLVEHPTLLAHAKANHAAFRGDSPFKNPLGPEVLPLVSKAA